MPLAPSPVAAELIDGGLGQRVAGAGAYITWNDPVYAECDLHRGLGYDVLNANGIVPVANTDQYFQTSGSNDATWWGTPNGRPNSSGFVAEIAYLPGGKPDSSITWGNVRLAVPYITDFRFDGASNNASANNTLYFSARVAAHF